MKESIKKVFKYEKINFNVLFIMFNLLKINILFSNILKVKKNI